MTEQTWTSIDTRRVLPASDLALVQLDGEASMAHDRQHLELAATMWLMREAMAGQPRAASYTPSNNTRSPLAIDAGAIDGEPPTGHHDPTGDAGTDRDKAAGDLRRLRQLVEQRVQLTRSIELLVSGYPSQPHQRADVEATPGEDWCMACWKDRKHHAPIATRPDGTARVKGLCRWCGDFRTANGFEPPTWLLELRHDGERITSGMVERARVEHRRQAATRPAKVKNKRKNRRSAPTTR